MARQFLVNIKQLKTFLSGIGELVDECQVRIKHNTASVISMDASSIAMVTASMEISNAYDQEYAFGINVENLKGLTTVIAFLEKTAFDDYKISIRTDLHGEETMIRTGCPDVKKSAEKEPTVTETLNIAVSAEDLMSTLTMAKRLSSYVKISTNGFAQILISAEGDRGFYQKTVASDNASDKKMSSVFNLEFLEQILSTAVNQDQHVEAKLSLKTDEPIAVEYTVNSVHFKYWLAPYMES